MDFRPGKGGIARVTRQISKALPFDKILSLHGNRSEEALYFNGSIILFALSVFFKILMKRPTLIVCDHLGIASLFGIFPSICQLKIVTFLHDEEAWKKVIGRHRTGLEKSSLLLCNSEYTYKRFIQNNSLYKNKTKVCLLGGVPESFYTNYKESERAWFRDQRPYCIFVSRLWQVHRYKGYLELIDAFALHYKKEKTAFIRLAIIGNGDDAEEVKNRIKMYSLENHIELFTDVTDEELPFFYQKSICLFFPSTREGFGFVFLEAMFLKKACIGIAGQPAQEIINEDTGLLLTDNKPETLMRILNDIERNGNKYILMGENGYNLYLNKFTEEMFASRFRESIKTLDL
jgi:glycosyltransferase involved in cell wall biosynthesis